MHPMAVQHEISMCTKCSQALSHTNQPTKKQNRNETTCITECVRLLCVRVIENVSPKNQIKTILCKSLMRYVRTDGKRRGRKFSEEKKNPKVPTIRDITAKMLGLTRQGIKSTLERMLFEVFQI